MSETFDEFWALVVGSTGALNPASVAQIRSAMQIIYDRRGNDEYAASIVNLLELSATTGLGGGPPRQLTFAASPTLGYSSSIGAFRISVPELQDALLPVKTFNVLGQWVVEPLYHTPAHELAHLVLGAKDPGQQLGYATRDGNLRRRPASSIRLRGAVSTGTHAADCNAATLSVLKAIGVEPGRSGRFSPEYGRGSL
jgi:hypothetical protein